MTCPQIEPKPHKLSTNGAEPTGPHPIVDGKVVVHVIVVAHTAGEPAVLLVEREPRIVEFPTLEIAEEDLADETAIAARIASDTGLEVTFEGYLAEPSGVMLSPPGSRFLLARAIGGRPQLSGPHVGWEWRPASNLLALQFIPKLMVDELRSYMNE
jgi:hypothetical protein